MMKTILATVYSVNPYKGSEEAMGWNYVYQAARYQQIIAVTRENNRGPIEQYMAENPDRYPGTWVETFIGVAGKTYASVGFTWNGTDFVAPVVEPD